MLVPKVRLKYYKNRTQNQSRILFAARIGEITVHKMSEVICFHQIFFLQNKGDENKKSLNKHL